MTKSRVPLLFGAALMLGAAAAQAQTGSAPVVTSPAASTETTVSADAGRPLTPTGPVATRAADDAARTRHLVRVVNENTDNIKAQGDFGAQLWLVEGRQFFEDWKKPETPAITTVNIVQRGVTVYSAIVFYGMSRDTGGLSNITYNIVVHRPDGSVYDKRDDAIGWQSLAPTDDKALELGRDSLGITIGAQDPTGLYTVDALVRDNVSRTELALTQHLVVR